MIVCILGAKGRVAKRHIKAWEELGIAWEGFDIGDTYDLTKYDVIDICTPPFLHSQHIYEAIKAGKPIICEKPLAPNLTEAKLLSELDHKIGIVYQFRFNPKMIKLKKEIEAGKYGDIKLVTSTYYRWRGEEYYKDWEGKRELSGGGTVTNVTIHYLDLMQWIFGYPTEIHGLSNTAKNIGVEDSAVAIMKFPQGAIGAYVVTSIANPQKHYEFSVYGTKGSKTIQLRHNEYHKDFFKAFLADKEYVNNKEALKSLQMAFEITK